MIINLQQLSELKADGKIIVLGTGTFDLFHYEHLKYLQDAKKQGDILVVAIKNNKCAALKGKDRPIIDEAQRIAIVDNIKCVDYTILVDYDETAEDETAYDNKGQEQWLNMFEKVFNYLRPDILYYEDNPVLQTARERVCEKYNIRGVSRVRDETVSTTKIIKKLTGSNF